MVELAGFGVFLLKSRRAGPTLGSELFDGRTTDLDEGELRDDEKPVQDHEQQSNDQLSGRECDVYMVTF